MKKFIFGLSAIAIIITGIFTFAGCEKEELVEYNITECVQDNGGGSSDNQGPQPYRYYKWNCITITDDGGCYVGMVCEGPFTSEQPPKCTEPGRVTYIYDENGARVPVECNSPIHPFPDIEPGRTWEIEFTKEHIEEIWPILQSMYEREILMESPQELWDIAPHRQ